MKRALDRTPLLNRQRLALAAAFSVAVHAFALFGIHFVLTTPIEPLSPRQPLEVVLVNSQSSNRPNNASAYAQSNLDGGGNVEEERSAKSPFPAVGEGRRFTPEQATQRVQQLEQEVKRLLVQKKGEYRVAEQNNQQPRKSSKAAGQDLVQRSLEIARLEAQIDKSLDMYSKMPKRRFIGARTQEYRFAQYVEDWRAKVERIGNLNYPEIARRQKIYGKLVLTVSIRADGSLESVDIDRSSGHRILDAAAVRIVKLAAPYPPFPPDIRKDTNILSITRTWMFTTTDQLETK